ncbi:hypothetical protein LGM42_07435 [Burkholderia sp. AU39826]|uniref:hypothetical protein n=1 Tax=Burkholderia sp. AU39826 TaxID=2879634 RepID=UPI001CF3D062|nr:hypothetical protein [Burkholderia sp. AU39826]MCA7969726.1 hypothetical protein [Burkholderia sp. AU39826]
MTPHSAPSTPRPLPRKREHAKKRSAVALASVNGTSTQSNCDRLTPAKANQKDEALVDAREGRLARIDYLRTKIRSLIANISHAADVELLDLMADEIGSFARHNAAQDARTWAATAAITLEAGLMQLARATQPVTE